MNASSAIDASQEFSFRNERHSQSNNGVLYEKLYQCYLQGKLTDVTLVSSEPDRQEFKCHKLILAAACEYFETMFSGNWRELHEDGIKLEDIDGDTLELFLDFAYRGVIILDEENIYNAFCLSAIFEMKGLEDLCVRYLTERDVPTNCAIELFVFARAVHCTPLIPRLSQFILNNLSEFPNDDGANGLLRMSLDDVRTLLTDRQPLSPSKEEKLWGVLVYWISKNYPTQEVVLQQLILLCQFDFVHTTENLLQSYYETTGLPRRSPIEIETEERLHLYVQDDANTCTLLKMYAYNDTGMFFQPTLKVALRDDCKTKTLIVGNRLYLYRLQPRAVDEYQLLFSVYSSVSLRDEQLLESPGDQFNFTKDSEVELTFNAASITGDSIQQRIYLLHSLGPQRRKELFCYDCRSNIWTSIEYRQNRHPQAEIITYFEHRLYLFGRDRIVRAYDPRAGELEDLRESGMWHCDSDRLCGHRGKLYVAGSRERVNRFDGYHVKSEVYDPVAGRWTKMPDTPFPTQSFDSMKWLGPLDNKLWMFGKNIYELPSSTEFYNYSYRFQSFDPFIQKWEGSRSVFRYPGLGGSLRDIVVPWSE